MILPYLHYDVFTGHPLAGNQLAVFPDARELDTDRMQRIAGEMNFSESTFVLPAERQDTDVRMRIFTPSIEMPMAGHPTIGSTFALAQTGTLAHGTTRYVFGLNVGPTPVDLEWAGGQLRFVWMTQGSPEFGGSVPHAPVALALGLTADDLRRDLPIEQVSCGVPYLIVAVQDAAAVDRVRTDSGALKRLAEATGVDLPLYLFAPTDEATVAEPRFPPFDRGSGRPEGTRRTSPEPRHGSLAWCRMFAPGLGVLEDPGTGSAAGPLGAYLVRHGLLSGEGPHRIAIQQGVAMGRPSRIDVQVSGGLDSMVVQVGGEAVLAGRGELFL